MKSDPKISIIMSVYNGENFLKDAINSVLNQSFSDFEFIITDDASTDDSNIIIREFKDKRIVLIQNDMNIGLTKSLNNMLSIARGEYIARMDADDICHHDRLREQISYFESHKNTDILCSWANRFGSSKNIIFTPVNPDILATELFWENCVVHPSVMFKASRINELELIYNENYEKAQDYDFWLNALDKKLSIQCLPKCLIYYRTHNFQISNVNRDIQNKYAKDVREEIYTRLNLALSCEEKKCIEFLNNEVDYQPNLDILLNTVNKLINANNAKKLFPEEVFEVKITLKVIKFLYGIKNHKKAFYYLAKIIKPSNVTSLYLLLKNRQIQNNLNGDCRKNEKKVTSN